MYQRILVPTDGSDAAEGAIDEAVELAAQFDAELHALYVMDVGDLPPTLETEDDGDAYRSRGERAVALVERRAGEAGIESVREAFVRGNVHEAIVEYAADEDVDLIVMGTRGRSGVDRLVLGSVTERVVRHADVPVLTVKADVADQ